MKKYIIILFFGAILIVGVSVGFFCHYYSDVSSQHIVDITKIIFQSMLTGSVTFCGLFLTILSQEHQNKKQNNLEHCPCIIVKDYKGLSAPRDITSINETEKIVICCAERFVRTIDLTICNCKSNYCLNCSIKKEDGNYIIGNIKDQNEKIRVALWDQNHFLVFNFEDVYGLKYQQEIKYQYDKDTKAISFVSCQPKRKHDKKKVVRKLRTQFMCYHKDSRNTE